MAYRHAKLCDVNEVDRRNEETKEWEKTMNIPDTAIKLGADRLVKTGYLHEAAAWKASHAAITDAVKLVESCGGEVIWRQ